ncbi:odorant receptor 63a-like [Musca domestica]|uniref:Odorant receptor n=1 Tax=Musca domestica TaxID=7370 RepID=A0A9J7DJ62_MUSDO|nr:odorant receptor 63a-like [Musca domestica]
MDTILIDISDKGGRILNPLKWIGMFSGCNIKYKSKFLHPLKILNLFLFVTSILACYGQLYYVWERRHYTFEIYIEAILIFFQSLISIWKLWMFTFSQDCLFDMMKSVENSEMLQNLEIFQLELIDSANIINDITQILNESWIDIKRQLLLLRFTVFGICSWYTGHSLVSNIYYLYISDENDKEKLEFPFPASFPVWYSNVNSLWHFYLEYFVVTMQIYLATVASITCSGLFSVISVHCLTMLRVLRTLITYSTSEHVPSQHRTKYLEACVRLHQNLLSFCSRLNRVYQKPSLGLFISCCLLICLLTFKASVDLGKDISGSIKVCLYLLAAFYELLIFCLNGQRITSESERLPQAIYSSLWFDENRNFKFMIQIMIMRTNQNIRMDVGGFSRMSLETLLTITRSSVSYFLFLRNCM